MNTKRRAQIWLSLVLVSLMMLASTLQAQHAPTRNLYIEEPIIQPLHSSGAGYRFTTAAADTCTVDPAKELFITDVSVVDDCYRTTYGKGACPGTIAPATRGAWTFGRLMEGIFATKDEKKLSHGVRQWLKLWTEDRIVNGELVKARPAMRDLVLKPWEKASKGGHLDMSKAPFRLLAIVFRMDAPVQVSTFPDLKSAGQFRMVYGLLDKDGNSTPFTIIFEYLLKADDECQDVLDWAHSIHALSSYEFGPAYNAALQNITDKIITPGAEPEFLLNGSALLAIRTNEAFLDTPWEMRSFALALPEDDDDEEEEDANGNGGGNQKPKARLDHIFNPITPAAHYQGSQRLGEFLVEFGPQILQGFLRYPITYKGEPFLAGVAQNSLDLGWHGPEPVCTATSPVVQRLLSVFTCQGCHGKDTQTNFLHVLPREAGQPAQLSRFMTGPVYRVTDSCNVVLQVNGDLGGRRNFVCNLLNTVCPQP